MSLTARARSAMVLTVSVLAAACSGGEDRSAAAAAADCDVGAASAEASGCARSWIDANLKVNEVQAIGTHNSFKQWISPPELAAIGEKNADAAVTLEYGHPPLAEQLDAGARQLEIDPYYDPEGGHYADPLGPRLMAQRAIEIPAFDASELRKPGLKVIHAPDIDYRSHCLRFVICLEQVKAWSDAHPEHSPILLMINTKSSGISWDGAVEVPPFDKAAFDLMDTEILSVFPQERIITPDEVRGDHPTLRDAVTDEGWPAMSISRGRVIFAIDNNEDVTRLYADGHASLAGRLAFINTDPDAPEAAYFTMNEPLMDGALIAERVAQGFLVRTRADADTREARTGDRSRLQAALSSGAQYISTDYMTPSATFGTDYSAALPGGGVARCNPVSGPDGCDAPVE